RSGPPFEPETARAQAASVPTPLGGLIEKEELQAFEKALLSISDRRRQALLMRLELDLDYPEIAEDCGFPSANAARMAIVRAVKSVSKEIERGRSAACNPGSPVPSHRRR